MLSAASRSPRTPRGAFAVATLAATVVALPPAASASALSSPQEKAPEPATTAPASEPTTNRFDGDWTIHVDCGASTEPSGAQGYSVDFPASVLNGRLFGSLGPQGAVGSVQVEGTITPDGQARLQARGRSGDPARTVDHAPVGTPYSYDVQARFDGATGSGERQEQRACSYRFTRR